MFTILVTGQVRDREIFLRLMNAINETRDQYSSLVYSTWSDELLRLPVVLDGANLPAGIEIVDAGSPFFAPTIMNRDVSSFIAQHRQLRAGLEVIDPKSYVIRLRADYDCHSVESFRRMLLLIKAVWKKPAYAERTIVCGADDVAPYFFEDRILLLAPRHAQRLSNLTLDDTYRSDYFNLFPEFQFYSCIAGGQNSSFFVHDHRYRLRAGCGQAFSEYDYQSFGGEYFDEVLKYLSNVVNELVFLSDAASGIGKRGDYDDLVFSGNIPRNFRIGDMREYYRVWLERSDKYAQEMPSGVVVVPDIVDQKRAFNGMYMQYFSGNTSLLAGTPVTGGVFSAPSAEFVGVSKLLVGGGESALNNLLELYSLGARGFELCFYLLRSLAQDAREAEFEEVASGALGAFKHVERMSEHVEHQRVVLKRAQKAKKRNAAQRLPSVGTE